MQIDGAISFIYNTTQLAAAGSKTNFSIFIKFTPICIQSYEYCDWCCYLLCARVDSYSSFSTFITRGAHLTRMRMPLPYSPPINNADYTTTTSKCKSFLEAKICKQYHEWLSLNQPSTIFLQHRKQKQHPKHQDLPESKKKGIGRLSRVLR